MNVQQKEIQLKLKKVLDKERYEHTMGVMYTSASLAMNYGFDMQRAMLAGLLHDCAKGVPDDEKIRICRKNKLEIRDIEFQNPFLLHSKLGAFFAKKTYGITDIEILHAIEVHTTGEPGMGLLDAILFAADHIEPNRDKAPNLDMVRKLCFTDLNRGVYKILDDTLHYLNQKRGAVDKKTKETYDYYQKRIEEETHGIS